MNKECVIWGSGKIGKVIYNEIIERGYSVVAYCDNNPEIKNQKVNNTIVINQDELLIKVKGNKNLDIVIGVQNPQYVNEIITVLREKFPKDTKYMLYRDIVNKYENDFLDNNIKNIKFEWNIDFDEQSRMWLNNFMGEVEYWLNTVARGTGKLNDEYIECISNDKFLGIDKNSEDNLEFIKGGEIVLDIGCGLATKYGDRLNNNKNINLIPIDPLASFYNKINSKYANNNYKKCKFGMFEFMANLYNENYADLIIINNALDHCIDPFKSLLECIYILKVDGTIYMKHRRAEALFEKYTGLHKWNLDCYNKEFIIWNQENEVNVSKVLQNIVKVKVEYNQASEREQQEIVIKITKKRKFQLDEFIDLQDERYKLAKFIEEFMGWTSEQKLIL